MGHVETLDIKGARGTVAVETVGLVFFKIRINDEVVKPKRGHWQIPMRNGVPKELRVRGFLPGFQRLFLDGKQIHDFGAHATLLEKIVMFSPFVLILLNPFVGLPVSLIMFFLNVSFIKNPDMPRPMKIAVPIINAIAASVIFIVLFPTTVTGFN